MLFELHTGFGIR